MVLCWLASWPVGAAPAGQENAPAASPASEQTAAPAPQTTIRATTTAVPVSGESSSATAPAPALTPTAAPTPAPAARPPRQRAQYPVPQDQPADYDLPNGHFYSQAVPGAPHGFGFTVVDVPGQPFWTTYSRLGGLQTLGYPVSRRFLLDWGVAQGFQAGVLLVDPTTGGSTLVPQLEVVPAEAREPEPPARLGGSAARMPWSGWWWPATSRVHGPYLFQSNGPLAKYDLFAARSGRGEVQTAEWERAEIAFNDFSWAGHCNGWAAAALLEPEPSGPRTVADVTFSVADQKGLLTAYHFADSAVWLHGESEDLSALDFHRRLVEWLGLERKGFVLTFRPSGDVEEVWSYPVGQFIMALWPDPYEPDLTQVEALLWLADNNVPADFVGFQTWKGGPQVFRYALSGPRDEPTGARWEPPSYPGGFTRPATIWYPAPDYRNVDRQVVSPDLDYRLIRRILQGSG